MKKILLSAMAAAGVMLAANLLVSLIFRMILPSVMEEYKNTAIFRPWDDPLMSLMFLQPFIVGLLLAWIWDKTKHLIKAEGNMAKGLCFGFIYFLFTLPGMIMSISSFMISYNMVMQWTIANLVTGLLAGWIISVVNPEKKPGT